MNISEQLKSNFSKFASLPFRPYQEKAINFVINSPKPITVVWAPTGCHAKGQKVLMYDGSFKNVEKIHVGDLLMGPDSKPRKVKKLISGYGKMYRIFPVKGPPFVVNEDHILSLKRTNDGKSKKFQPKSVINISVGEYLKWSKTNKHLYKLYRTGVNFKNTKKVEHPYILGIYLGDGCVYPQQGICNPDKEIISEIHQFAKTINVGIRKYSNSSGCPELYFRSEKPVRLKNGAKDKNNFSKFLQRVGLHLVPSDQKFVPERYKTSSRKNRLEILAGLLDTDGYLGRQSYDFISKSRQLAEDAVFLSKSLGLAAYIKESWKKSQTMEIKRKYFRVLISGNVNIIPCRVERKKADERLQKKDVLVTGFKITRIRNDFYYGFELDGDGLYLLDDFTVTHNSGKSLMAACIGAYYKTSTYLVHSKQLQDQLISDFPEIISLKGRNNYKCLLNPSTNCDSCVHSDLFKCPHKKTDCLYEAQKEKALQSPHRCVNYSYFLLESNFVGRFSQASKVMLCDESDLLESIITNFVSLEIPGYIIKNLKLTKTLPKYKSIDRVHKLQEWIDWSKGVATEKVSKYLSILNQKLKTINKESREYSKLLKRKQSLTNVKMRLKTFVEYGTDEWILNKRETFNKRFPDTIILRPIWTPEELSEKFFFRHAEKFVLLSATFPPPQILGKLIGRNPDDIDVIDIPSNFPVEKRKVYFDIVGNLTSKTFDIESPKIVNKTIEIINKHENEKGLIHTVSYKLAQMVMEKGNGRLITHNSENRDKIIEKFIKSSDPLVLVSPSLERGISLDDDKARFVIWMKAPYLNLGDKLTSKRVYSGRLGGLWYKSNCSQTFMQGCGRAVRHMDDYAITYVLDRQIFDLVTNQMSLFPEYFLEAIDIY